MSAIPYAARPLRNLAQKALLTRRSNGIALDNGVCHRCQTVSRLHTGTVTNAAGKAVNVQWGDSKHVPKVPVRKGKRQRLIEAGKQNKDAMSAPKLTPEEIKNLYGPELFVFRSDVASGNIQSAMQTLDNLLDLGILTSIDTMNLAQAIHQVYRSKVLGKSTVIQYLKAVIQHIQSGKLATHHMAHVHILSTLKEAEDFVTGNTHWQWLKNQGVEQLDSRVLGAAIEYLVYQGVPQGELEKLYEFALKQFSKVYDEGGGVQHRATRLMLIQGIATARLLHRDWKKAYDALDTITRLNPTQVPSRIYEVFIFNRPAREGFLILLMACRAGTRLPPKALGWVMADWWKKLNDVTGMLQLLTAHLAVGGKVTVALLNILVYGFLGRLPEAPQVQQPSESKEEWQARVKTYNDLVNPVFECISRTIGLFRLLDIEPSLVTYNSIITQSSRRSLRKITELATEEVFSKVARGEIQLEESAFRVQLGAYGDLHDQNGIRKAWEALTDWRRGQQKPSATRGTWVGSKERKGSREQSIISWKVFIRACFKADMKPFVLEQLRKYEGEFNNELMNEIRLELHSCERRYKFEARKRAEVKADEAANTPNKIDSNAEVLPVPSAPATSNRDAEYAQVNSDVKEYVSTLAMMEKVIRSPVAYDFTAFEVDHKLLGLPHLEPQDITDLKEVYEHFQKNMPRNPFITANHDPKTDLAGLAKDQESGEWGNARSVTGFTINQLRFENWLMVNRLLFLAEENELNEGKHIQERIKGVVSMHVRKEENLKVLLEKMKTGDLGSTWLRDPDELVSFRAQLASLAQVPSLVGEGGTQEAIEIDKAPSEIAEDTMSAASSDIASGVTSQPHESSLAVPDSPDGLASELDTAVISEKASELSQENTKVSGDKTIP